MTGIAITGMIAARHFWRKTRMTSTTSRIASASVCFTASIDWAMNSVGL